MININDFKLIATHWRMVITEEHLPMQYILIALELNIFQKKLKNS